MIEFPYGIADFYTIRREGMVYVDRTSHIRNLERLGRILVFLRPRRFANVIQELTEGGNDTVGISLLIPSFP